MAVADAAVKPSPPPPPPPPPVRIVVAVLAFVRFVLAAMPGLVRVARVVARALLYLCFATLWVTSAATAARIVARHACRKGSALLVFLEAFTDAAFKFYFCIVVLFLAIAALLLLAYLVAAVSGSGSEFKKRAFGEITWESAQELFKFPRAAVLGFAADLAFILLIVAGFLVWVMSPNVEGSVSQGQMITSVIVDVGLFGIHAVSCFVIIPAFALDIWRKDQADRKSGLTVTDC